MFPKLDRIYQLEALSNHPCADPCELSNSTPAALIFICYFFRFLLVASDWFIVSTFMATRTKLYIKHGRTANRPKQRAVQRTFCRSALCVWLIVLHQAKAVVYTPWLPPPVTRVPCVHVFLCLPSQNDAQVTCGALRRKRRRSSSQTRSPSSPLRRSTSSGPSGTETMPLIP